MNNVLDHLDKRLDYGWLSRNPNITIGDVLQHPHLPWDYRALFENRNITLPVIRVFRDPNAKGS